MNYSLGYSERAVIDLFCTSRITFRSYLQEVNACMEEVGLQDINMLSGVDTSKFFQNVYVFL